MSLTRSSARMLQWSQKRGFKARPARTPLMPHYTPKVAFDYSETEPCQNYEKSCILADSGANYEKFNDLHHHYKHQELYMQINDQPYFSFFSGLYGPHWCAHFGGGYLKFLRRRTDIPGTYNHTNPIINWWRRKLDERGVHFEFPRGQDYQIVCRWFLTVYLVAAIFSQVSAIKAHFANAKPLPPADDYPPRINLPFYVYIIHDMSAPNFEQ